MSVLLNKDEIIDEGGNAVALAGDVQDQSFAKSLVELAAYSASKAGVVGLTQSLAAS